MYLSMSSASVLVGTGGACGGGPGAESLAQLQSGMCLVALSAIGDHYIPLPIMTGWLTRLLEFCDGFRG